MLSIKFREGISETIDILNYVDEIYLEKIPKKLIDFFEKNKLLDYKPKLDHSKKLSEMNLKNKTKDILSIIYLNYWCDTEEKNKYTKILKENDIKYENELRKQYDPNNLFKEDIHLNTANQESENIFLMETSQEPFFIMIKKWLYNIFNKIKYKNTK